jgi:hypothetical protein
LLNDTAALTVPRCCRWFAFQERYVTAFRRRPVAQAALRVAVHSAVYAPFSVAAFVAWVAFREVHTDHIRVRKMHVCARSHCLRRVFRSAYAACLAVLWVRLSWAETIICVRMPKAPSLAAHLGLIYGSPQVWKQAHYTKFICFGQEVTPCVGQDTSAICHRVQHNTFKLWLAGTTFWVSEHAMASVLAFVNMLERNQKRRLVLLATKVLGRGLICDIIDVACEYYSALDWPN